MRLPQKVRARWSRYGRDVYAPMVGGYVALIAVAVLMATGSRLALGIALVIGGAGMVLFALAAGRVVATRRRLARAGKR